MILQPNDEIWYISTDGNIVEPYSGSTISFADVDGNNIQIISNTYEDDKGIIRLQKECYQIGISAFGICSSLASIAIPDSVTAIGNGAFYACTSLTGITIPDKVTTIGYSAFSRCSRLENITVLPGTPPTLGSGAFDSIASNAVIYVPNLDYFFANNWYDYRSKMALIE